MKQYIITLLLLGISLGAWAKDYVFKTSGGLYVCMTSTPSIEVTSTFDPTTCIWTGPDYENKYSSNGYWFSCKGTSHTMEPNGANINRQITIQADGKVTHIEGGTLYYYLYNIDTYGSTYKNGNGEIGKNNGFEMKSSGYDLADAIYAYEITVNGDMAVTATQSASYISAVGGTVTITPSLTGTAYYKIGDSYYTTKMDGPYTSPEALLTTPKYSYSILGSGASYASVSADGVVTCNTIPGTDVVAIVKVTAWRDGFEDYTTSTTCYVTLRSATVPAPSISKVIRKDLYQIGNIDGATIYYTTDGTDIDASASNGTIYTGPFTAAEGTVIKARAVRDGQVSAQTQYTVNAANEQTGIHGTTVLLNDLEDHDWTYYSGVDESVDGGNYNSKYKGLIYSPNPRNVKITYKGVDLDGNLGTNVAVSGTEPQNQFVYLETIEKNRVDMDGDYPYHIIPNPFSKRPAVTSGGNTTYYGFAGWKVVKGAEYILRENGNQAQTNDVLNLEESIHFNNLGSDDSNAQMFEVELEATWTPANVYVGTSPESTFNASGTYETNFWVVNGTPSYTTLPKNCTITNYTPDGGATATYTDKSWTKDIVVDESTTTQTTKFEYITFNISNINGQGRNLFLGRGITCSKNPILYGSSTASMTYDQVLRVESGVYSAVYHTKANVSQSGVTRHVVVYGCDYDRANSDNSKFTVQNHCEIGKYGNWGMSDPSQIMIKLYAKSGDIMSKVVVGTADTGGSYYFSPDGGTGAGARYLEIQGGQWGNIAGGQDTYQKAENPSFIYRMKGGSLRGCIYGAAEYVGATGIRVMVFTGGTVNGWVACGANGTSETGGLTTGESFLYIGGSAVIGNKTTETKTLISRGVGGTVFGAGCGYSTTSSSGEMKNGTNVVIADDAFVEHGVYGGGSYGFTTQTSNVYITGGTVEGRYGARNGTETSGYYDNTIPGGVFGGACQNKGGSVNIYMTGGNVGTGLFGGSNSSGALSGNVKIKCVGGNVGTSASSPANVHGGGYGSDTSVAGDVDVTIGGAATVYGNVYGGGAEGKTNTANTDVASITKHTNVNMTGGIINGSLFGAGLGESAAVITNPVVTMSGGTVTENVFGGGDAAKVDGNTSVTVKGPSKVNGNVYGGGNAAEVTGTTHVQIGEKKE